jgi:predicted molibdopterin-dependent oxidoreductase YjgC
MFFRLPDFATGSAGSVEFRFDGQTVTARAGDTIAAALFANGITVFGRRQGHDSSRAPYCLMGVCYECLVVVDGISSQQACRVEVKPGMQVEPHIGRRDPAR